MDDEAIKKSCRTPRRALLGLAAEPRTPQPLSMREPRRVRYLPSNFDRHYSGRLNLEAPSPHGGTRHRREVAAVSTNRQPPLIGAPPQIGSEGSTARGMHAPPRAAERAGPAPPFRGVKSSGQKTWAESLAGLLPVWSGKASLVCKTPAGAPPAEPRPCKGKDAAESSSLAPPRGPTSAACTSSSRAWAKNTKARSRCTDTDARHDLILRGMRGGAGGGHTKRRRSQPASGPRPSGTHVPSSTRNSPTPPLRPQLPGAGGSLSLLGLGRGQAGTHLGRPHQAHELFCDMQLGLVLLERHHCRHNPPSKHCIPP